MSRLLKVDQLVRYEPPDLVHRRFLLHHPLAQIVLVSIWRGVARGDVNQGRASKGERVLPAAYRVLLGAERHRELQPQLTSALLAVLGPEIGEQQIDTAHRRLDRLLVHKTAKAPALHPVRHA